MTITRLSVYALFYVLSVAFAYAGVAVLQQPSMASGQGGALLCKASLSDKSKSCAHGAFMSQRNSISGVRAVAGTPAGQSIHRYPLHPRSVVDQYQNAVTPPVDSGH